MRKWLLMVFLFVICNAFAQSWRYDLRIVSGSLEDTLVRTIGVDYRASDNYDDGLDVVIPVAPPSGFFSYFPISDPSHPFLTMLATDIRNSSSGEKIWRIVVERDMSSSPRMVVWDRSLIPAVSSIEIGANYPGLRLKHGQYDNNKQFQLPCCSNSLYKGKYSRSNR